MKPKLTRRKFLKKGSQAGMACCVMMIGAKSVAAGKLGELFDDETIDPKKLNFCGYTCPKDCKFFVATIENNPEKKKKAFEIWKIKERYGVDFDEKTAVCWNCKEMNKTQGVVVSNCTVRACAMDKGFDACIECKELNNCNKDLWKRFPDFYKGVLEMQAKYNKRLQSALIKLNDGRNIL